VQWLACVARIVDAGAGSPNLRHETELRYRVTRDSDEMFLVEVAYTDLMAAFPPRADSTGGARTKP
jgi:hypothetical protein